MKERWYYLETIFYLKVAKWLAKPYRWVLLHIPAERRVKYIEQLYTLCDKLVEIEDEFPEARIVRIQYLFIGLAAALDGFKQMKEKYPYLTQNN